MCFVDVNLHQFDLLILHVLVNEEIEAMEKNPKLLKEYEARYNTLKRIKQTFKQADERCDIAHPYIEEDSLAECEETH